MVVETIRPTCVVHSIATPPVTCVNPRLVSKTQIRPGGASRQTRPPSTASNNPKIDPSKVLPRITPRYAAHIFASLDPNQCQVASHFTPIPFKGCPELGFPPKKGRLSGGQVRPRIISTTGKTNLGNHTRAEAIQARADSILKNNLIPEYLNLAND